MVRELHCARADDKFQPIPGTEFVLKADDLGSLAVGSPIYYRHLPAGQVISYELAKDGKSVDLRIFVEAPYDSYVHVGTRFWKVSGLDVKKQKDGPAAPAKK